MATRKPPFTEAERRILDGARRRVAKLEKILSGGRVSPGGEYFVEASVKKITPRTPFVTVSRVKDFFAGVSHGGATAQRKAGVRAYTSAAAEAKAEKQSATKATLTSKIARIKKARREARRRKVSSKVGIAYGRRQRARTIRYLNENFAQHERYLNTGREELARDPDEYRKVVHLMYEYFGDDERMDRMKESYTVTAMAA